MILSDRDIRQEIGSGRLGIDPYNDGHVQPASYDLTLGTTFIEHGRGVVPSSVHNGQRAETTAVEIDTYIVNPGEFVLAHTEEHIRLPSNISGDVKGRSSVGRLGVIPHTAGWIDPGFEGQITLELVNHSPHPVRLHAGMRIAQMVFTETRSPAQVPYDSKEGAKYVNQQGVTGSRIEEDTDV
jgi:dCTP deaminase